MLHLEAVCRILAPLVKIGGIRIEEISHGCVANLVRDCSCPDILLDPGRVKVDICGTQCLLRAFGPVGHCQVTTEVIRLPRCAEPLEKQGSLPGVGADSDAARLSGAWLVVLRGLELLLRRRRAGVACDLRRTAFRFGEPRRK